ncbi:hypothetical protein IMZ48_29035 [Candidatus Bathyarchaeota archaeon]|nr:hypothetical protein [Candidatus Bathyarchaeota archaeon]
MPEPESDSNSDSQSFVDAVDLDAEVEGDNDFPPLPESPVPESPVVAPASPVFATPEPAPASPSPVTPVAILGTPVQSAPSSPRSPPPSPKKPAPQRRQFAHSPTAILPTRTRGGPRGDYRALAGVQSRKRKATDTLHAAETLKRPESYREVSRDAPPDPSPSYFALAALTVRPYMAPKLPPQLPHTPRATKIPENLQEAKSSPEFKARWRLAMLVQKGALEKQQVWELCELPEGAILLLGK